MRRGPRAGYIAQEKKKKRKYENPIIFLDIEPTGILRDKLEETLDYFLFRCDYILNLCLKARAKKGRREKKKEREKRIRYISRELLKFCLCS